MTVPEEILRELARETGRQLAELGVREGDAGWIREQAQTVASLGEKIGRGRRLARIYRWARRAARIAR